jgi:hypothetical protein
MCLSASRVSYWSHVARPGPTFELGISLEKHCGIFSDLLLSLVQYLLRDLVQTIPSVLFQRLDEVLEVSSLPIRETFIRQGVFLSDFLFSEWDRC